MSFLGTEYFFVLAHGFAPGAAGKSAWTDLEL
jgi:hypothetical protein